ncbi:ABC transporter ATP-binding protein [Nesterenkonia muleiensis]|uniref:ABC transporter ATP-binding protein n=1 Tax=Nesterenkonia muleiensis TaxID=2282648 RepID=UPI000E7334CB|nr:ABC transporter ATP-binding protein [Nesterenkonia muleiensis]
MSDSSAAQTVLRVEDLRVAIGRKEIVRGVNFQVGRGGTLGIVGESGSGKSMSVLAATGLLDAPGAVVTGTSTLHDDDGAGLALTSATPKQLRRVHGNSIGFVFQDPSTSLNPLLTLERQISESLETHRGMTRRTARARALELLEAVGIPDPESRLDSYPHQLSGGQRQRVMIAIALACDPAMLIADEPTTALDVTTQAQIIDLVKELQHDRGTAVVWISHDLGVIGQVADEVLVLKSGEAVEHRETVSLMDHPSHAYTTQLLAARPVLGRVPQPADPAAEVVLAVEDLDVAFPVSTPAGKKTIHAVDSVSFEVRRGHTLGIVGESGSGKSTIANVLTGLVEPQGGTAQLGGTDLLRVRGKQGRGLRRRVAMVFQDPFASLNSRMRVGDSIGEPLTVHRLPASGSRSDRIRELLELVDLPTHFASRYPHELSGGQRQRVSIARALALEPEVVILDESTAALDVSIQARVLDLLARLQSELGLTYLFIAHDLAVVQQMSHDVLVMRNGQAVEQGAAEQIFDDPQQDYTRMLLAAIPPERPAAV